MTTVDVGVSGIGYLLRKGAFVWEKYSRAEEMVVQRPVLSPRQCGQDQEHRRLTEKCWSIPHTERAVACGEGTSGGRDLPRPKRDRLPVVLRRSEVLRIFAAIDNLTDFQPCFMALDCSDAVSICDTVRRSARAAEAGVHTIETRRRKRYAVAVTSAWVSAVRAEGRIPMYSTSWENAASQGVAEKVGLVQYAVEYSAR